MNNERLYKVLLASHVSEKATRVGEYRQYVFKVVKDATKQEIKKAVELLFKVKVAAVRVCNVKGKVKMFRHKEGQRSAWKKAYVTLADGQSIDFASMS